MKMKTYLVESLSAAVEQIKQELGPDAVILSTRKAALPGRGWGKKRSGLEVTAAVDTASPIAEDDVVNLPTQRPGQTIEMMHKVTEEHISPLRDELTAIQKALTQLVVQHNTKQIQKRVAPLDLTPEPIVAAEPEDLPVEKTQKEISAPKVGTGGFRGVASDHVSQIVCALSEELLWHRLSPEAVEGLAGYLMSQGETSEEELRNLSASWLIDQLPELVELTEKKKNQKKIIALVGPTGAGKTTTLVKIASQMALEGSPKIAFITLDHFRIGAEDQLRKYAEILRAPCYLATDAASLEDALRRTQGIDYVFIDTTGRSPNDADGLAQIAASFSIKANVTKSLVVPATLQGADLSHVLEQYQTIGYDSLIVSKLDEASCFGSLFNASYESSCGLAYFTMGQQVPEDLESASHERVVDCLLNFSGNYPVPKSIRSQTSDLQDSLAKEVGR